MTIQLTACASNSEIKQTFVQLKVTPTPVAADVCGKLGDAEHMCGVVGFVLSIGC
jgi:hypothetical protein